MTVQIGSQSDVPNVGDPIVSPWYQDTAKKIVHPFASLAALNTWSTAPNGAHAHTIDTGEDWIRVAGAWKSTGALWANRVEARSVNVTTSSAGFVNVPLVAVFAAAPVVVVTHGDVNTPPGTWVLIVGNPTFTNSFNLYVNAATTGAPLNAGTIRINYIAYGTR